MLGNLETQEARQSSAAQCSSHQGACRVDADALAWANRRVGPLSVSLKIRPDLLYFPENCRIVLGKVFRALRLPAPLKISGTGDGHDCHITNVGRVMGAVGKTAQPDRNVDLLFEKLNSAIR